VEIRLQPFRQGPSNDHGKDLIIKRLIPHCLSGVVKLFGEVVALSKVDESARNGGHRVVAREREGNRGGGRMTNKECQQGEGPLAHISVRGDQTASCSPEKARGD